MERRNIGIGIGAIILIVGLFLTIGPMFNLFTILALSGYDTIIDHIAQTAKYPIQTTYGGTTYTMFLTKSPTPTTNVLVSVTANGSVIKTFSAPLTACSSASCVGYFGTTSPGFGGTYGEQVIPQAVCFVNINNGPIVILANPLYAVGTSIVQGEVFCYSSLAVKIAITTPITPSTCQNSCGNLKQAPWPDCGCIAGVCANTCPSGQSQRAAPDCSCYSTFCSNTCASGQSQKPYPDCSCITPACSNICGADQLQKPSPDCSCYSPSCSAGCASGQSQRAYPDCGCYNPTVACDSSCQSGCVGTIATNCTLSVCDQTINGKTICENGTLSGCLPTGTVPTCDATNQTCEATWAPVCGTNLQTYPNECMAGRNNVSILFGGACPRDIQWLGMALILIALIWLAIVMLKW